MEALTGGYRVYFTAVWILFAAELLCLAATAPPLRLIAPVWLWAGLAGAVGLLLAAAVLRCMLLPFPRHGGWFDPVLYVWHLPRGLKVWYGIALCLVGIGLATAGGAEDVRKDAAGYYLEHHDTRTPLTPRAPAHGPRLTGPGSRAPAHGPRLTGPGSRAPAHGPRPTGPGPRAPAHGFAASRLRSGSRRRRPRAAGPCPAGPARPARTPGGRTPAAPPRGRAPPVRRSSR